MPSAWAALCFGVLQHDDAIMPEITDAIKETVGDRTNPNGCTIPLTWCELPWAVAWCAWGGW